MSSRYADAIPLPQVDAETVADALMEVMSRTGIPDEIITDQESVFTGRLMDNLWTLLSIKKLKTAPYHPQTNGCIERWHGMVKTALKKCKTCREEWVAYRCMPHSSTGFSPFEMIHGKRVRGPLDVLKEGWLCGEAD